MREKRKLKVPSKGEGESQGRSEQEQMQGSRSGLENQPRYQSISATFYCSSPMHFLKLGRSYFPKYVLLMNEKCDSKHDIWKPKY